MGEIIRVEGLGKVFRGAQGPITALDGIDISVNEGDVFGIIGLSGAGKSTLVRCLNYLEKPTQGRVIFDGRDLGRLKHAELLKLRRSIGMIFQDFNLMSQRNALKNVCFPMEVAGYPAAKAEARAKEMLELVGLTDRMRSYPSQLSGGQKQRVAIARALSTEPKVLLCDEATSALDPNTTRQILELLRKINREMGVTIIVITHEMRVIESICNRVAVLDRSRIVEYGDVKDVFVSPKSQMARQLILPDSEAAQAHIGRNLLRVVFDGSTAFEPIISDLALKCRVRVNILGANTRMVDGKAYGQMLLQLPEDEEAAQRARRYLDERNIAYKEETLDADSTAAAPAR